MSFFRHGQIYQSDGPFAQAANKPGATLGDAPGAHRLDEFATGYSLAGCSPALPASASPASSMPNNMVAALKTTTSTWVGNFQPAKWGKFIRP
jgi:hypothetical protein